MGKNLVSKPMHEWSLCFHLSFALLLVFELQVKIKGCYKRSQRHLPHWVENVLWPGIWLLCFPVGLWRLLRLWPERRQGSSAWLAHVANGRSSVSSGSIVWPSRSRVSLYDVYQPPFCLSISQLLGFPLIRLWSHSKWFLKLCEKEVIPLWWFNAARPECFMINFSDCLHDTVSSSDEVGRGNKTAVYSFSHIIL